MGPNFGPIVQKPPKNSGCPQWVQIVDPLSRSLPKTQSVNNGSSQKLRLSTMRPNFGPIVQKPPKSSGCPQWVQILDPLSRSLPKTQAVHNGSKFWIHCPEASQKRRLSTMGPNFGPIVQKPPKNSGCPQWDPNLWTHCPEASQILRLSTIGPNFGPIVLKPPKNSGWPQWVQILEPLSRSLPKTQAVHNGSKFWTHCPEASQQLRLSTMGPNFGPIVQKPLKNSGRPKKPPKNSGCPQ